LKIQSKIRSAVNPGSPEGSSRSKRAAILAIAAEQFGTKGFDEAKWSDIAEAAGIGTPALYHYFESKAHCLFTLLQMTFEEWYVTHRPLLSNVEVPVETLRAMVWSTLDISPAKALRLRLLVSEQGRLSTARGTGREEDTRLETLKIARRIDRLWTDFLKSAMDQGSVPKQDPTLLTHAVVGLLWSVWAWYRPTGKYRLKDLQQFYTEAILRMVGVDSPP
jgi:AcrR family transcriptional regulator